MKVRWVPVPAKVFAASSVADFRLQKGRVCPHLAQLIHYQHGTCKGCKGPEYRSLTYIPTSELGLYHEKKTGAAAMFRFTIKARN